MVQEKDQANGTATSDRMVKLIAKGDGEEEKSFMVKEAVAKLSNLLKSMLSDEEDTPMDDEPQEIPLPNVTSSVLQKVLSFCEHQAMTPMQEIEKPLKSANLSDVVGEFEAKYVDNIDQEQLFQLILAANYMDIKPLLDLTCAKVASMIKGKSPEEIRKTFNIVNDFTPEEERQVREESKWCEDM